MISLTAHTISLYGPDGFVFNNSVPDKGRQNPGNKKRETQSECKKSTALHFTLSFGPH